MKLLSTLALLSSVILAQTFRSNTTLVRAEALVEENGHVLTGLRSDDFSVLDEGQPQPIANFASEPGAIRLVLLLDASGSMQPAARQLAATGLAALSVLRPDDMVALMTFDRKATLRVPLTINHGPVIAGVSKIASKSMGGTYRYLPCAFGCSEVSRRWGGCAKCDSDPYRQCGAGRHHRNRCASRSLGGIRLGGCNGRVLGAALG